MEHAAQTPALALSILPASERYRLIEQFNATAADYRRDQLVHQVFEAQVERTPQATAVSYADQTLTYAQLNRKANQLACYLSSRGIGPDEVVGICVERGLSMVVGLLGILKAGAAYLPLDPNYPAERPQYMLEDAAPRVVLTQAALREALPVRHVELIDLDSKLEEIAASSAENIEAVPLEQSAHSAVYVIYTSGSTGRPKGTVMSHGAMVNLLQWHAEQLPLGVEQRVLQFAALSFDVTFQETFSTLCAGGTLVLLEESVRRDARALLQLLSSEGVARLFVPPMMLQSLAESFP